MRRKYIRSAVVIYILLVTCGLLWWTSMSEQNITLLEWFDFSKAQKGRSVHAMSMRSGNIPSIANARRNVQLSLSKRRYHFTDKTQTPNRLHQEASCEGNFIGYDHTFAQLTNLVINPEKGKGRRGGENCSEVFNQPEKNEYFTLSYGYFELLCTNKKDYVFNPKSHLSHWQEVLKTTNEIQKPERINPGWTIAVVRYEYANLYHTMTDYYNAFFVTKMFNMKPGNITILWIDGHPSGALDETWRVLFGNVLRAGDLEKTEMFNHMIWGIRGYDSHLNNHNNKNVPYLEEFRTFFLSRHGISTQSKLNCSELNIMFLWRRNYLAHPRNPSGSVSRKIKNEEELLDSAKKAFHNHKVFGIQIDKFGMKRQLEIIAGIDILIGMHGAGLTHTLFLPAHAGLIELYPTYWSSANRHFVSMATWRKLHYLSWNNIDSTKELPDHFTIVDVEAVTALIGEMKENICG